MTAYTEIMEIMESVIANNSSLSLVEDSPGFSIIGIASSREMTKFRKLWKTIQSLGHDEVLVLDSKSWTFEKKERHEVSFQEDFYIYAFVFSII